MAKTESDRDLIRQGDPTKRAVRVVSQVTVLENKNVLYQEEHDIGASGHSDCNPASMDHHEDALQDEDYQVGTINDADYSDCNPTSTDYQDDTIKDGDSNSGQTQNLFQSMDDEGATYDEQESSFEESPLLRKTPHLTRSTLIERRKSLIPTPIRQVAMSPLIKRFGPAQRYLFCSLHSPLGYPPPKTQTRNQTLKCQRLGRQLPQDSL